MSSIIGELGTTGHLEVWKEYSDGTKELVHSDQNTIVSGMGVGLALLFAGGGSSDITDYQIRYMQVGKTSDITDYGLSTFTLEDPLVHSEYATSSLIVSNLSQFKDSNVIANQDMVFLPMEMIRRVAINSVQYILALDTDTANEQTVNEIGLLMKNPTGASTDPIPILVAYKTFTEITKKAEFSLIFKWTISF
jgi:hypothetical protein